MFWSLSLFLILGNSMGALAKGKPAPPPAPSPSLNPYLDPEVNMSSFRKCHMAEMNPVEVAKFEEIGRSIARLDDDDMLLTANIEIPVVFHDLAFEKPREDFIDDKLIDRQFGVLQESFNPYGISFKLIGITHHANNSWAILEGDAKEQLHKTELVPVSEWHAKRDMASQLRQGDYRTLNVYIHRGFSEYSVVGVATFPYRLSVELGLTDETMNPSASKNFQLVDDVRIWNNTLPGNGAFKGYTLVHEVGHWLGLLHPFQGGCNQRIGPLLHGDGVWDTVLTNYSGFGCPIANNYQTCGHPDPIHNFMMYTDDACMTSFTEQQAKRMHMTWNSIRFNKLARLVRRQNQADPLPHPQQTRFDWHRTKRGWRRYKKLK